MENSNVKKHIIPPEFLEPNWRFWSFILLAIVGIYLMMLYPVPVHDGLTDPFYSPTVLVLPLVVLFRADFSAAFSYVAESKPRVCIKEFGSVKGVKWMHVS